jgi:MFS family permease
MLFLREMGWSLTEIGILEGLFCITQAISEVPSGYFADFVGRKKSLIIGEILVVFYALSFLFAEQHHILVCIGFVLFGIGLSLKSGADQALVYDNLTSKNQSYAKLYGVYNAVEIIAIALSGLAGGIISHFSWSAVFIITACMHVFAILILCAISENKNYKEKNGKEEMNKRVAPTWQLKQIITFIRLNKKYRYLIYVVGITQATISILYQYGGVFISEFGYSTPQISVVMFIISIISAGLSYKVERLIQLFGAKKLIFRTMLTALIVFVAFVFQQSFLTVCIFVLFNVLFEVWDTTTNTVLHENIPSKIRASLISVANLLTAIIMAIESVLIGELSTHFSLTQIFIAFGMSSLGVGLIVFRQSSS